MDVRTEAPCPYFPKCGGCQLLKLPYGDQLLRKQRRVSALLAPYCRTEPILGMAEPWHYRNKVCAAFGVDGRGRPVSGIYQPSSHRIVPVETCLIEDETADAVLNTVRAMLPEFRVAPFDEVRETGFLRHVLIRRGFATGQVMVVLVGAKPYFALQKQFTAELLRRRPEVATVVLNVNPRVTPVVLGAQEKILAGKGTIEDVLCGRTFRISSRSFFQVNPVQTERLYALAADWAGLTGREHVLDAYCGTGAIGLTVSGRAARVTGVELNRDAVKDAVWNARRNGAENCRFYAGDAGDFLAGMAQEGDRPDVVFLDPPRTGCTPEFLAALSRARPDRLVYISCAPDTLARDLAVLARDGWSARRARPVDMFPHTEHVETVCLMSRVKD